MYFHWTGIIICATDRTTIKYHVNASIMILLQKCINKRAKIDFPLLSINTIVIDIHSRVIMNIIFHFAVYGYIYQTSHLPWIYIFTSQHFLENRTTFSHQVMPYNNPSWPTLDREFDQPTGSIILGDKKKQKRNYDMVYISSNA